MKSLTLVGARILGGSATPTDLVIAGGRIVALRPTGTSSPEDESIDATRLLVTPGLIDGHHHSHENFFKGCFEGRPLELVMNFVRPLEPLRLTPRQVYVRTLIGAIQALKSGATTLVDDLNVSPLLDQAHVEAALQAYEDCGIRALLGVTLFDRPFFRSVPFVDDEFPADVLARLDAIPATPAADIMAFARRLARSHHPAEQRVGTIVAASAPQRCSDDFLCDVRRFADDFDLPAMIHVQETRLQAVTGHLFYGQSMVAHLEQLRFLRPRTTLIHAVWLTPDDIARIAAAGASVQHNPTVNMKLGSGLMPMRELLDAGVNVGLGTDGCGLIETADMLRAVANTANVQKLRGDDCARWIGAPEAWHAGTIGGARALGMEKELGRIEVGMKADVCGYSLDSIAMVPLNDSLRQLVYGETGAGLRLSVVDGRIVLRHGRLTRIDEAAILAEALAIYEELRPQIEHVETSVAPLIAPYQRIYQRCLGLPVDPATFPTRLSETGTGR